jgi:hypothetical protein
VAEPVLEVLRPAVLEASRGAAAEVEQRRRGGIRHRGQRLERARSEAGRAARQYQAGEPEDRLAARTLERRREEALRAVRPTEAEFDRFVRSQPRLLDEADRERIRRRAGEVPAWWRASTPTPADRRQVVGSLVDRVALPVDPHDDRVTVRVEWAGGSVRERTLHREVQGSKDQQAWPRLSARLAARPGGGAAPKAIAAVLDREGVRPPQRACGFTAGMVRRSLREWGSRPRVPRTPSSAAVLSSDEWWLHDLARASVLSPHALHGWRKKGWIQARPVGGRGGPWAVGADAPALDRRRALRDCPRSWADRERLAD